MFGVAHDLLDVAGLGDQAAVEHDDVLADLIRGGQIVRDVDQRNPEFVVKFAKARQNGRSERSVDHRDRLIGYDNARADQQGTRHHDPLALTPAQLVRIAAEGLLGPQADDATVSSIMRLAFAPGVRQSEFRTGSFEDMVDPIEWVRQASNGSWKITWTSRRKDLRSVPESAANIRAFVKHRPPPGSIRPSNRRAKVVLPLPLSPTKAVMDGDSSGYGERKVADRYHSRPRIPPP